MKMVAESPIIAPLDYSHQGKEDVLAGVLTKDELDVTHVPVPWSGPGINWLLCSLRT